ncbi:MAG: hypothetical protein EKK64_01755 [Neisseriaceae bacterium]|nr:MAG: hypothetical protein EKK64_01755 [Neisseriaceae bacterium]
MIEYLLIGVGLSIGFFFKELKSFFKSLKKSNLGKDVILKEGDFPLSKGKVIEEKPYTVVVEFDSKVGNPRNKFWEISKKFLKRD